MASTRRLYKGGDAARIDVKEELWYGRYVQMNEGTLCGLFRKDNKVEVRMLCIQGHVDLAEPQVLGD